jgi:HB1, ASXL, restriction endonuclease HTH domain
MSKKKTTTSKPEATRPSVIPIMRSRGGKKKVQVGDAPTTETSPAADVAKNASPDQPVPTTESPPTPAAAPMSPATDATPADSTKKRKEKAAKEPKPKKMSCLDAAAKVLTDAGTAMTTGEMIEAMGRKKLWSSPNGQTPSATLYSAIQREINTKGKDARFKKTERGKFAAKA